MRIDGYIYLYLRNKKIVERLRKIFVSFNFNLSNLSTLSFIAISIIFFGVESSVLASEMPSKMPSERVSESIFDSASEGEFESIFESAFFGDFEKPFIRVFEMPSERGLKSVENSPQERYIQKYYKTAIREMYRSGVPASITLAQGLLESNAGRSKLSSKGNNHFGIKCHDWKGKRMFVDDDKKGECFRVYSNPEESFRDHSDFLRYRDRYKFIFQNKITDYKSWAYGLKKAGYATDPAYARKLIKLIEDYNLGQYDSMVLSDFDNPGIPVEPDSMDNLSRAEKRAIRKAARKEKRRLRREKRKLERQNLSDVESIIPETPLNIEMAEPIDRSGREKFHFSLSRQLYSQNGVPFIYSVEGETYASIADANNLFLKELLRYNDLCCDKKLQPGTIVYLRAKKNSAAKGIEKYIVEKDGESLRDICQRFGVKKKTIMKINNFSHVHQLREGDTIILQSDSFFSRLFR